jgi:glycosyltransferase involved in cell wall biosynthesis
MYAFEYDIVISTYPTASSHFIAHRIKLLNPKIYWVADYRDMWSISHLSKPSKKLKSLELFTVGKHADLITTISNELSIELSKFLKREVHEITNGFDMTELELSNLIEKNKIKNNTIKIVYTGMIYPGRRDPSLMILAIINLEKKYGLYNKFELNFYGSSSDTIKNFINADNKHFINQCGYVTRDLAITLQNQADFVLLLESDKEDAKGILTGKLFEYIFSGTPIISIGSIENSSIWKVLNNTKTGKCYLKDSTNLENDLLFYLKNNRIEWFQPEQYEILKFTRKNQAEILYNLINNEYKIKR